MSIKTQLATAMNYPCRFAFECAHSRFAWANRDYSFVLTINHGYE